MSDAQQQAEDLLATGRSLPTELQEELGVNSEGKPIDYGKSKMKSAKDIGMCR